MAPPLVKKEMRAPLEREGAKMENVGRNVCDEEREFAR